MVIVLSTILEGMSLLWISRISKPSLRTIKFRDWVKLSDPKQALRGRHPMLILDCPDSEASRARGFCPSITRASNPQLHFGNPISKSYRLTKRISDKRTKNQAKTNKTEHGIEKRGKAKVKSKPIKSKSTGSTEKSQSQPRGMDMSNITRNQSKTDE
ncbi:hypothetical protein Tco_0533041 [Tanacetum coccineum]